MNEKPYTRIYCSKKSLMYTAAVYKADSYITALYMYIELADAKVTMSLASL